MTVDFAYSLIKYIVNKSQNGGYVAPNDFNNVINAAQYQYLDFLLGDFEQYQNGRPIARVELGMNQIVRQRLTAFIDPPTVLTIDNNGFAAYPAGFQQMDAAWTNDGNFGRIFYLQQDAQFSILNSQVTPVATNPVYLVNSAGLQFYPKTLGTVLISFVKTPTLIKWASNPDANGRPVYDPVNSVDPKWYDVDFFAVIARALRMISVSLKDVNVQQFAEMIIKEGA